MAVFTNDRSGAVEIRIPPQARYLAMVRDLVAAVVGRQAGVEPGRLDDLRLAVTEAVTNAISAQQARGRADRIKVSCIPTPGRVEIHVNDRAGGFDPSAASALPDVTDPARLLAERGMGLWLMRIMSDEHTIAPTRRGTEVRLVLYTASPEAAPDGGAAPAG